MTVGELIRILVDMPADAVVFVPSLLWRNQCADIESVEAVTQWRNLNPDGPWRHDLFPDVSMNPDQMRRPAVRITTERP
jgi:hypothetical protein